MKLEEGVTPGLDLIRDDMAIVHGLTRKITDAQFNGLMRQLHHAHGLLNHNGVTTDHLVIELTPLGFDNLAMAIPQSMVASISFDRNEGVIKAGRITFKARYEGRE